MRAFTWWVWCAALVWTLMRTLQAMHEDEQPAMIINMILAVLAIFCLVFIPEKGKKKS